VAIFREPKRKIKRKTAHNKEIQRTAGSPPLISVVEAVEKVNLAQICPLARKYSLSGCSLYDDLKLARSQVTPKNHPVNAMRGATGLIILPLTIVNKLFIII
jgi:hypothetical protein